MSRVVVVGQGYVGLPLAMRAVGVGNDVIGFDVDQQKVDGLQRGESQVPDVVDDDVAAALATGRYRATSEEHELTGFDVAVITVPTPLSDGVPDVTYVESAASSLGTALRRGAIVVLESTTYPGTTEELLVPILERTSGLKAGVDFHVGYSPERIDPGNATWTFVSTPKVVAGLTERCGELVRQFYATLVSTTVAVSSPRVAEMTKLLENTYRHVNIALVNELAIHAHAMGINMWEVIDAASTKPFGFARFHPGPGVGGHCLPIDPSYLSWRIERQLGSASRFVDIANDINNEMPAYVVRRVQLGLNERCKSVKGSRILVLGLAYKRNSNDARETPARRVIEGLAVLGACVCVHDPHVGSHELDSIASRVELTVGAVTESDAVVLLADHDDVDYTVVLDHARYVFDARNRLSGPNVERL